MENEKKLCTAVIGKPLRTVDTPAGEIDWYGPGGLEQCSVAATGEADGHGACDATQREVSSDRPGDPRLGGERLSQRERLGEGDRRIWVVLGVEVLGECRLVLPSHLDGGEINPEARFAT